MLFWVSAYMQAEPLATTVRAAGIDGAVLLTRGAVPGTLREIKATTCAIDSPTDAVRRLLPDLVFDPAQAVVSGKLGVSLTRDSALLFQGRTVALVGSGSATIRFAPSKSYPEKTIVLEGRQRVADLTTLRRIARARTQPAFPPKTLAPPTVASGTLVIVGGGGMPVGLAKRFVTLAGGSRAVIAVIPISTPEPLPEHDPMARAFQRLGAEVVELRGRTSETVDTPENLALLKRATGIWFGGGRQWRFVDAYEGTRSEALMHAVLSRGGVVGGSSAGASIQGEYLARGNPLGPEKITAEGYERGFGFLPGVAIDQHFTQRNRFSDMTELMGRYPQLLGIALDEATAIIVTGSIAEVIGQTRVCFYNPQAPKNADGTDYTSVAVGQRYDLVRRRILTQEEKPSERRN